MWEALEVPDKMGFSQHGHGSHCFYPEEQKPELQAYVEKFLVGTGTADTEIMQTDGDLEYDEEMWVDWTVPDLD